MDQDLADLLAAGVESERLECKRQLAGVEEEIRRTICAFANDLGDTGQPGFVVIGIDDATWEPSGIVVDDRLLARLSEFRTDGRILPPPITSVGLATHRGVTLAVIRVRPSDSPPVRVEGRVWVRVGSTTRRATPEEERTLVERSRFRNRPFDLRPVPDATMQDLDLHFFRSTYLPVAVGREVLAENERSLEDQLLSCRFLSPDRTTPTVAGLLMIGIDPQAWLPGAYIQFARFAGAEMADPIVDQKRLDGTLYQQAKRAEDLLTVHIAQAVEPEGRGVRREDTLDYPLAALRELLFNAIIHRTYENTFAPIRVSWFTDRVEILSPGGLFGQVTPENFRRTTDYRNPTIAEAMKVLGYVERFGVGIPRVYRALRKNGNPEPEFCFEANHVLVSVWRRKPA